MDTMKTQKDMTVKDKAPRSAGVQYAIGGERGGGAGGGVQLTIAPQK